MKRTVTILIILSLLTITACTPYHHEGAATGAAIGGVTGQSSTTGIHGAEALSALRLAP